MNYELETLGWKAFQDLCATITREIWGQTVQAFFDSYDGGRDGAFRGEWHPKQGEEFRGSFTVQCKFTSKRDNQLSLASLRDELEKAKRLAANGNAANYILMTNAHLTGVAEEKIRAAFLKIPQIECCAVYGTEWISQIIRESSRLRMLVPRVYGLGDLSQILDERAYTQAREILSALGDDLGKFVITDAYRKSAKALVEEGFVLLLGEPAAGKSTIAAALAVGALDEWGCSTLKIRDADDFVKHWNPKEPKQFFWVDDAFGVTQFDWSSVASWNRALPHVHTAVRHGAKILFTSRDYIYRSARQHLKESAFPRMRESQVVINVEQLSKTEREQILYNHIRLGTQTTAFRRKIKPLLPAVADNARFIPEIARRLGNPLFTKKLAFTAESLKNFVEHPLDLLVEVIRTIDAGGKSALALVFMRGGILPSPLSLSPEEDQSVRLLGGSLSQVRESLNALNESLVLQTIQGGICAWRFKHPTVRDAFAALVAEDRELLDIYLRGTPIDKLLSEISCGDTDIRGVKVMVASDRYATVISRLNDLDSKQHDTRERLLYFLAYRCDCGFLKSYISANPNFIASLQIYSYLSAVSDVSVLLRLHEFGLLPEEKRKQVVETIKELAVGTPDADFLNTRYRILFTEEELSNILQAVRGELLPNLSEVISDWFSNYNSLSDKQPEQYFSSLVDALGSYLDEFQADSEAVNRINDALEEIEQVISELQTDEEQESQGDDFYDSEYRSSGSQSDLRSIFDDVDV